MLKLAQTDQQTDQQTGQKQYVTHYYSGGYKNVLTKKNTPTLGTKFVNRLKPFSNSSDIMRRNVLTNKNAPHPSGHVFQPTRNIFQLIQEIIGTNLLTKLHEDPTINIASIASNDDNAKQKTNKALGTKGYHKSSP
ncbi:hypothetical protein DPMN_175873 [Dreissena polymorpha]|uniref:Uncharacterized protein n=1 Tax=Dreissena polymorpha TaxID=45954 RepID=A0A9D4E934_DREPO|nr:hypothetical protein DPMN_175873 [Dreissena polymorpha]